MKGARRMMAAGPLPRIYLCKHGLTRRRGAAGGGEARQDRGSHVVYEVCCCSGFI